jgi:hypothetical protein
LNAIDHIRWQLAAVIVLDEPLQALVPDTSDHGAM